MDVSLDDTGAPRTPDTLSRPSIRCRGHHLLDECPRCKDRRVRWYGCGRPDCIQPGCRKALANRRGKRVHRRLSALGTAPWGIVVLTLPPGPREAARDPQHRRELRRKAREMVRAWVWWWCFHGDRTVSPDDLGGVDLFHPCGGDAWNGIGNDWHPHLNILVPLVTVHGRRGRYKVPGAASGKNRGLAFSDLRARWAAICREYGFNGTWAVQVRYEPKVSPEQRIKAARYFGRGFPDWQRELQRPVYFGVLHTLKRTPKVVELEAWPDDNRCRCGGWYATIAVEGPNGWVFSGGTGPPDG